MLPLDDLARLCANLDGQLATIADHHAKHVAARTLSEFSNGGSYATTMAHLARVLRDEFQCAANVEEQAKKREAVKWSPPPMPKPHEWWDDHGTSHPARCMHCGVLRDGAMAKLNCGSPVNNLTGKDRGQLEQVNGRA